MERYTRLLYNVICCIMASLDTILKRSVLDQLAEETYEERLKRLSATLESRSYTHSWIPGMILVQTEEPRSAEGAGGETG